LNRLSNNYKKTTFKDRKYPQTDEFFCKNRKGLIYLKTYNTYKKTHQEMDNDIRHFAKIKKESWNI